jgi:hypothetical protein
VRSPATQRPPDRGAKGHQDGADDDKEVFGDANSCEGKLT